MRTTVTLDQDVARLLKAKQTSTGRTFKQVLNDVLRAALGGGGRRPPRKRYRTIPMAKGVRPGINLDNIADLLAQIEGEDHR
jgi:hypothetical protein